MGTSMNGTPSPQHGNGIARKIAIAGLALIALCALAAAAIVECLAGPAPAAFFVIGAGAAGGLAGVVKV